MTWAKAGREPDTGLQGTTSTQIVPLIKVYPFYFWVRSGEDRAKDLKSERAPGLELTSVGGLRLKLKVEK